MFFGLHSQLCVSRIPTGLGAVMPKIRVRHQGGHGGCKRGLYRGPYPLKSLSSCIGMRLYQLFNISECIEQFTGNDWNPDTTF